MRLILLALATVALGGAEPFTIVMLPDTQFYSERLPQYFDDQTQWIVDNVEKENIVFVTQVGDLVEHGKLFPKEWDVAEKMMQRLNGVVPWGAAIGNHDYDRGEDSSDPDWFKTNWYRRFFGPQRFEQFDWYGGASDNGLNSYQTFEAAGQKFIALHLELDYPDAAIAWAERVLAEHLDALAFVSTHVYLFSNGRPQEPYLLKDTGNSAEVLWQRFIRRQPQIFMVLCGHYSGEAYQISMNLAREPVYEIMVDYQGRDEGGAGFLRLIRIDPDRNEMRNETYSPSLDRWEEDHDSKFTVYLNLEERREALSTMRR